MYKAVGHDAAKPVGVHVDIYIVQLIPGIV